VSLEKNDQAVNQEVMRFLNTKFPEKDCNQCLQRYVDDELWEEKTTTYRGDVPVDVDREEFTKSKITFRNKCQKGLRVLGIRKYQANDGFRQYEIVWRRYPANFNGDYTINSKDFTGGALGDFLFGGGQTTDINMINIGRSYNNAKAGIGDIQYLRVIEENETAQSKAGVNGEQTLIIDSYTKYSNIYVNKGDKIYIHASGDITTGMFSGSSGPIGKSYSPLWNIVQSINYGALMLKIGNGDYFATGEDLTIIAPNSGNLAFVVNDIDPTDNSGSYSVICSINKPFSSNLNFVKNNNSVKDVNEKKIESQSQKPQYLENPVYNLKEHLPKKFKGYITNSTVNRTSFSENELFINSRGAYSLIGSVDNVNLIGSWYLTGYEIISNGKKMYKFSGNIEIPSTVWINNIPIQKKIFIPTTWLVEINDFGIKGTYQIPPNELIGYTQYGVVNLY
jgi:hypothetical protein